MQDYIPDYNEIYDAIEANEPISAPEIEYPYCEICNKAIKTSFLYEIDKGVFVCPHCIEECSRPTKNYISVYY